MAENDFLIFDENQENMLEQSLYASDEDRADGFKTGLARSNVNNKVLHQTSLMASAFGDFIVKQGGQASDYSKDALISNMKRLFAFKPYYEDATFDADDIVFDVEDEVKIYISLRDNNIGHPLTDTDYWKEVELGSNGRYVGEIITSTLPLTDARFHLLDGTLLQYGIYSKFIDYIANLYEKNPSASYFCTEAEWQASVTQYGVCGKFVYDSTNNTVRLPKVTGIIEGTTDLNALGDLVEAGLPFPSHTHTRGTMNITGKLDGADIGNTWSEGTVKTSGALYATKSSYRDAANGGGNGVAINFNASRNWTGSTSQPNGLSSVYGNSSTVQPQTVKMFVYIVIANGIDKTDTELDIDNIVTDLNNKADIDFANITETGTSTGSGWAMPSETYIDLTLGASGASYTAPANGWVLVGCIGTAGETYMEIAGNNVSACASFNGGWGRAMAPVKKGYDFNIYYGGHNFEKKMFRFVYAQGSESEAN